MTEERVLSLPAETVDAIDRHRGRMSRSNFIESLLQRPIPAGGRGEHHVTEEEFQRYRDGMRSVLRDFLEFCVTYGMGLGVPSGDVARLFTAALGRSRPSASARNGKGSATVTNGRASRN